MAGASLLLQLEKPCSAPSPALCRGHGAAAHPRRINVGIEGVMVCCAWVLGADLIGGMMPAMSPLRRRKVEELYLSEETWGIPGYRCIWGRKHVARSCDAFP